MSDKNTPPTSETYGFRDSAFYWLGHLSHHFNRELIAAMRPKRITVARWRVLAVLAERPGISVNELAAHAIVERTALIHVLKRLETERLVSRRTNDADKRIIELTLTEAGLAEFQAMLPAARQAYAKAVEGIAAEDLTMSLDVIRRMLGNLGPFPFV
jgi:DNA-binding MarR family transcriptional regulator